MESNNPTDRESSASLSNWVSLRFLSVRLQFIIISVELRESCSFQPAGSKRETLILENFPRKPI